LRITLAFSLATKFLLQAFRYVTVQGKKHPKNNGQNLAGDFVLDTRLGQLYSIWIQRAIIAEHEGKGGSEW
jgi:hypothetical protein